MANTQGERKFVRQQEKYSLAEKKELGVLNKNVTPHLLQPPCLIHFAVYSNSTLIKTPPLIYSGPKSNFLYKR